MRLPIYFFLKKYSNTFFLKGYSGRFYFENFTVKPWQNKFGIFCINFDYLWPRHHKIIAVFFLLDKEKTLFEHYQTERKCFKTVPN